MGRLWQTIILRRRYSVFEYMPFESLIKERQSEYYDILSKSDSTGESTGFIEFMPELIKVSFEDVFKTQHIALTNADRIHIDHSMISNVEAFSGKNGALTTLVFHLIF
jgi:Fic family protein